jgi:hypothetical protein
MEPVDNQQPSKWLAVTLPTPSSDVEPACVLRQMAASGLV